MSTPEWMKKFREIGQKGEEEVTAMGNDGFVKTAEPSRRQRDKDEGAQTQTSIASSLATSMSGEKSSSSVEDVAALFHAAGNTNPSRNSRDPPTDETSDPVSSDLASSDLVSSAALSSTAVDSAATSSYVDSTDDDSSEDDSSEDDGSSEATDTDDENGADAAENKDEDFGDSWVVDKDKLKGRSSDEIDSQPAADAKRPSLNPGESFITEEVFVDEDGNEILVDENGNEIEVDENGNEIQVDENDDEIQVDENGNEIHVDENGNEIQVDENGNEIQDYEALVDESMMDLPPHQRQPPNIGTYDTLQRSSDEADEEERRTLPSGAAPIDNFKEQQRILGVGKNENRSRMSWCIPLLVFAVIVASILVVIFLIVYNEEREFYGVTPTMAPTPINYLQLEPTASSSGSIDAAATTEFDDIQNDCNFAALGLIQPNVVDQCNCDSGKVDILADDVRARWKDLVENFIPTVFSQWNEPMDSCSPKNQALLWLSSGINNGGEIDNLHRLQRYILAIIYYEQGGTEWRRSMNWLSGKNVCEWEGVECNNDRFIRILNLDQNGLRGQLSDITTKLNTIEAYFVSNNNLIGSIPDTYFNDDSLRYIDFSGNKLSGGFSPNLTNNSKLARINLASNNLSGPIPNQIGKIEGLQVLNIESNAFSGTLPSTLFSLSLNELSIGGNKFSGPIPGGLPEVSTLTSISLGPNIFTGDIPTSLDKLTALKRLSIVGVPGLSGRLPVSYGLSFKNLVELAISETNVEGDIPDQYSTLTKLDTLRLSDNNLRGAVPSTLSLLTNLKHLSLNGNMLTGTIPSELGLLSSLQVLEFHSNNISGIIPDEFGNLYNINTLLFDRNFMNGRVPDEVCALRNAQLYRFVVDCPTLVGESQVDGIICGIPDCCTQCL